MLYFVGRSFLKLINSSKEKSVYAFDFSFFEKFGKPISDISDENPNTIIIFVVQEAFQVGKELKYGEAQVFIADNFDEQHELEFNYIPTVSNDDSKVFATTKYFEIEINKFNDFITALKALPDEKFQPVVLSFSSRTVSKLETAKTANTWLTHPTPSIQSLIAHTMKHVKVEAESNPSLKDFKISYPMKPASVAATTFIGKSAAANSAVSDSKYLGNTNCTIS